MKYFGAHVSAAGGPENAPLNAHKIGATGFALFTKNQRQWSAPPLTPAQIAAFGENCRAGGYAPRSILPHDSYLINLGSPDPDGLAKSRAAFFDEMQRCEQLGLDRLNFHPGSHVGQGVEKGIELVADQLNGVLAPDQKTTVLLETMSGKGSELGKTFEELAAIIERVDLKEKLGVYSAGYDIVNSLDAVLEQFDSVLGLERLHAIHLNDSMTPFSSFKDHHETIGKGSLGEQAFINIINHPSLREVPFFLETPRDDAGHGEEIAWLKEHYRG